MEGILYQAVQITSTQIKTKTPSDLHKGLILSLITWNAQKHWTQTSAFSINRTEACKKNTESLENILKKKIIKTP